MAGGHSEAKPSKAAFYIVGTLWLLILFTVTYLYFSDRFVLYSSTFPEVSTSTPVVRDAVFSVTSSAYADGGSIPVAHTCDAKQISPPLSIKGTPENARSLVIIMEDHDIPKNLKRDGTFLHWNVFNIPPETVEIAQAEIVGVQGASGNGVSGYMGMCPPSQYEPTEHRYYLDLYALDTTLELSEGARVEDVRAAMDGHVLASTTLMGRYEREKK